MGERRFSHLRWKDRLKIEKMLKEKRSVREIADALHVHNSTIYREIRRGMTKQMTTELVDVEVYCPETAQRKYQENLQAKGPDLKIGNDHDLAEYIENKIINDHYSPAAALAKIKEEGRIFSVEISEWTLYSYITKGVFRRLTNKDLPMRGKKKNTYRRVREARLPSGDSIENREESVSRREDVGHWEMDSIMGPVGSKAALLVLTERLTRWGLVIRVPDHTAESVVRALNRVERRMGKRFREVFRTITVDNGSEFMDCAGLQRSYRLKGPRTKIYYCHPYSPQERGSNENMNRILRRWFPKGTNFDQVTEAEVAQAAEWMNNYPRRILGWRSAGAVFEEYVAA